jgi:hypothetical protein
MIGLVASGGATVVRFDMQSRPAGTVLRAVLFCRLDSRVGCNSARRQQHHVRRWNTGVHAELERQLGVQFRSAKRCAGAAVSAKISSRFNIKKTFG